MRSVLVLCLFTCSWLKVSCQEDMNGMKNVPKYDSRYDYLELDDILNSKRLVRNYVDCLINVKPCSPEGKALKRILPEALRTKCVRCTERQKKAAVKVIRRLKNEYPEEWAKLSMRWDPTGDFTRFFEEYLAKEQFNIITPEKEPTGADLGPSRPYPPAVPVTPPPTPPPPGPTMSTPPPVPGQTTSMKPVILNRFGEDGELMTGETGATSRPTAPTMRPRPTVMTWVGIGSETMPTRYPVRPVPDIPPPCSTTIALIDEIGFKIRRTTELVTDILRNTVRAVIGR